MRFCKVMCVLIIYKANEYAGITVLERVKIVSKHIKNKYILNFNTLIISCKKKKLGMNEIPSSLQLKMSNDTLKVKTL